MKRRIWMCAWALILAMLLPVCGAAEALPPSSAMKLLGGEAAEESATVNESIEQMTETAQAGVEAMFNLGVAYDFGDGVERDMEQAIMWYERAAACGDVRAMFNLGVTYDIGDGVEMDDAQAVAWYEQAAEAGSDKAMFNLGIMYYNGEGVEADEDMAVAWLERAVEAGYEDAQEVLDSIR